MKALLFGFGALLGWSVWANAPQLEPAFARGSVGVVLLVVVLAYLGGRSRGRGYAVAAAHAHARAQAHSDSIAEARAMQLVNVHVGAPAVATAGDPARSAVGPPPASAGIEHTTAPADRPLPWLDDDPQARQLLALQEAGGLDDAQLG